jgi:hypothetical protein
MLARPSISLFPLKTIRAATTLRVPDTEHHEISDSRRRKKELMKKIGLIGHKEFICNSMRQCYYMCNPSGERGILKCVPNWSNNKGCPGDALNRVLDRYPDYLAIVVGMNFGGPDRPPNVSSRDAFVAHYGVTAQRSMNNGRSNFTRAIKRNFFQPGMDAKTRHVAPDPHCVIYGDYQLAKGCLKNEVNCEVHLFERKPI